MQSVSALLVVMLMLAGQAAQGESVLGGLHFVPPEPLGFSVIPHPPLAAPIF